jgi:hypothetical protein
LMFLGSCISLKSFLCGGTPKAADVREGRKLLALPGGSTLVWHSFCLYLYLLVSSNIDLILLSSWFVYITKTNIFNKISFDKLW